MYLKIFRIYRYNGYVELNWIWGLYLFLSSLAYSLSLLIKHSVCCVGNCVSTFSCCDRSWGKVNLQLCETTLWLQWLILLYDILRLLMGNETILASFCWSPFWGHQISALLNFLCDQERPQADKLSARFLWDCKTARICVASSIAAGWLVYDNQVIVGMWGCIFPSGCWCC